MHIAPDMKSLRAFTKLTPTTLWSMVIGFCSAFCFMRWEYWLLSLSSDGIIYAIIDGIIRAPSLTLALIPQLLSNRFLSWTEISLYTSASWAIIFGVEAAIWQRLLRKSDSKFTRREWFSKITKGLLSGAGIFGIVLASWVIAFILCLPFGVCVFRLNLTSIMSPGLGNLSEVTGICFPPGTILRYSDYSSFQGAYDFSAKIDVSKPALRLLMKSLPPPHRASAKELESVNRPESHPWQQLDTSSEIMVIKIPEKGFKKNGTLIDGNLWIYADGPKRSVIYLSGHGHS